MTGVDWDKITEDMHMACLRRRTNLRGIARDIGIPSSGLTRLRQGRHLSADALAALVSWLYPDSITAWIKCGLDSRIDMEAT